MRVLLVTHRFPPFGLSGVERLSEQTARLLIAAGHPVTVLTRRRSAAPALPTAQAMERDGVPVISIAGGCSPQTPADAHRERLELLFERTLLDARPDVVLVSHLLGHSPLYVEIAQRLGVPVVLELHDFYVACERAHLERVSGELCDGPEGGGACARHCFAAQPDATARWALRTHLFRRALERADATIAPSRFVADWFERSFGLQPRPIVAGPGVDVGRPLTSRRPPLPPLRLAIVGMVAHHKGAHVAIDAIRTAGLPAVRLTLLGGATQPYLRALIAQAAEVPG
ncbi:MAG TPA: glycosyltransferase, partial [Solirubrobacteraceae bacterium]|nr:glycosyltransferase [Solirubrobacteraceae bacterium]